MTQLSFLRLLTTDAVMRLYGVPPLTNAAAWTIYNQFQSNRRIGLAKEPSRIESFWKSFCLRETASPKLWMDAYLAAFAMAGRHQLLTTDTAFRQFDGLDAIILSNE